MVENLREILKNKNYDLDHLSDKFHLKKRKCEQFLETFSDIRTNALNRFRVILMRGIFVLVISMIGAKLGLFPLAKSVLFASLVLFSAWILILALFILRLFYLGKKKADCLDFIWRYENEYSRLWFEFIFKNTGIKYTQKM